MVSFMNIMSMLSNTHIRNIIIYFEESFILDINCITLNSLLVSRMNSPKQISTCTIILKLYEL